MKKLSIKIRNLLRATAGIPVSEPTMVTKEFPVAEPAMVTKEFPVAESEMSTKEIPVTEKKKKTSWTDFISSCVSSLIMSFGYVQKLMKFFGSVFMWSIILYVVGYFVPELRYEVLSPVYNWVDLYLSLLRKLAELAWNFLMKFVA